MMQRWHDRTFVYCHGGIYGRFLADDLVKRREPFVFIDIGANQGLYSLIAASNPACVRAIAFEPVAATFAVLNQNLELNGLSDRVQALQMGISDRQGRCDIHVPPGHTGMASLAGEHKAPDRCETLEVETIAAPQLDDLLPDDHPLIVKVDVEGHEATVIGQLLACTAAQRVEAIFYEIDTRWSDASTIAAMLQQAGFEHFRRVGFGHHFDVMATR